MPDHEDHAIADQLARRRTRLFRIASVIHGDQLHLLAENAALGVEVSDGEFGAGQIVRAKPAERPGQWAGITDQDVGVRRRSGRHPTHDDCRGNHQARASHPDLPQFDARTGLHSVNLPGSTGAYSPFFQIYQANVS